METQQATIIIAEHLTGYHRCAIVECQQRMAGLARALGCDAGWFRRQALKGNWQALHNDITRAYEFLGAEQPASVDYGPAYPQGYAWYCGQHPIQAAITRIEDWYATHPTERRAWPIWDAFLAEHDGMARGEHRYAAA